MKTTEEVMRILEAYDLTQSFEAAARLAGCDAKTVARYVALRDQGVRADVAPGRDSVVDPYLDKIEEWVEHSRGDIRADVVHDKLEAMGYAGSERTTRRAVALAKAAYVRGHRRIFRPWVPEPGLWFQWDWGAGPHLWGRETNLWCAWLAWSRYRVIIPTWDKTLATVVACIDSTLREFGGVPTYALTDNEKTVTTEHVCGIAVRDPDIVTVSRHYGMTVHTCVPADPQSKGGSEATVRIAKADLHDHQPPGRLRQLLRARGRVPRCSSSGGSADPRSWGRSGIWSAAEEPQPVGPNGGHTGAQGLAGAPDAAGYPGRDAGSGSQ
jgi:transposase